MTFMIIRVVGNSSKIIREHFLIQICVFKLCYFAIIGQSDMLPVNPKESKINKRSDLCANHGKKSSRDCLPWQNKIDMEHLEALATKSGTPGYWNILLLDCWSPRTWVLTLNRAHYPRSHSWARVHWYANWGYYPNIRQMVSPWP